MLSFAIQSCGNNHSILFELLALKSNRNGIRALLFDFSHLGQNSMFHILVRFEDLRRLYPDQNSESARRREINSRYQLKLVDDPKKSAAEAGLRYVSRKM